MIELINVSKAYKVPQGKHVVLNNVNLQVEKGQNVAILGLNGAGKSTLIRMLSGAELPDSGKVIRTSSVSWPVGFSGCFNGSLTGEENLRFVARIYGADIAEVTAYVEEFSGLGEYMQMPVKTYSSGMRSKLAFGLSLAIGFEFYLIDEAFSVGDVTFREKAKKEIEKRTANSSLIFVSHSIQSVKEHCNCGAVLCGGDLTFYSDLNQAIAHYSDICHGKRRN